MDTEYTLALLIDTENVSPKYYDVLIEELEEIGNIKIKRAYGDFNESNSWKEKTISEGILPIQASTQTKKKNSTDLVLAIDAMDIFYSKEVNSFCVASSDSDFSRLAQRLKEGGMYVVAAGEKKTPKSLSKSSNKFLMLDDLYNATVKKSKSEDKGEDKTDDKNVEAPTPDEIKDALQTIISSKSDSDGWVTFTLVLSLLDRKYPQFNYKTYGAKTKKDFFTTQMGCEFKKENKTVDLIRFVSKG